MQDMDKYFNLLYKTVEYFITDTHTQTKQNFTEHVIQYKMSNRRLADFVYNIEITTGIQQKKQGYITMYRGATPGANNQRVLFELKFGNCSNTLVQFGNLRHFSHTVRTNRSMLPDILQMINRQKTDNQAQLLAQIQNIK